MKSLKSIRKRIIPLSTKQSLIMYIIIASIFQFVLFYAPTLAEESVIQAQASELTALDNFFIQNEVLEKDLEIDESIRVNFLPEHEERKPVIMRTGVHTMTAYNSDPRQTDNTPCITANGFDVCKHGIEDTVAANFLKFGTKVMIPELFGDRVFIVRDRMNKRYPNRVDVWLKDYDDAIKFGVRVATIHVIE